jgi:hypothetical protein
VLISERFAPSKLRNAHFIVGTIALAIFLATGQYMYWWHGHLRGMDNTPRLLFRSAHIYLLWSALLNTILGLYIQPCEVKWCRSLQWVGSLAILIGPPLLLLAFFFESWLSGLVRPYAQPAIYVAFGGTLIHVLATIGERSQAVGRPKPNSP